MKSDTVTVLYPSAASDPNEPQNAIRSIQSSRAGEPPIYIYTSGEHAFFGDDLKAILRTAGDRGLPLTIDREAVAHMIHHGIPPVPRTAISQVRMVVDRFSAEMKRTDDECTIEIEGDFPYYTALSRGDSVPSVDRLRELLVKSVEKSCGGRDAVLFLSAGKDSISVALALAEIGHPSTECVTYADSRGKGEDVVAAAVAQRLGLKHRLIELPREASVVQKTFEDFFEASPLPCCDAALAPYLLAADAMRLDGRLLVDGTGNDRYMGYVPPTTFLRRHRAWFAAPRLFASMRDLPFPGPGEHLLRSPAELAIYGGPFLPARCTKSFFEHETATSRWWAEMSMSFAGRNPDDLFSYARGVHYSEQSSKQKARLIAGARDSTAAFPWCDETLAEYYFHLPEPFRFDAVSRKNKILLRQMLAQQLQFDDGVLRNRGFEFDRATLLRDNWSFIRHEILSCRLWSRGIERFVNGLGFPARVTRRNALGVLALFMVSGWFNRCRYLGARG